MSNSFGNEEEELKKVYGYFGRNSELSEKQIDSIKIGNFISYQFQRYFYLYCIFIAFLPAIIGISFTALLYYLSLTGFSEFYYSK